MSALPELFENSIDKEYKICRKKKSYFLTETGVSYQFTLPSKQSAGFRIEIEKLELFEKSSPSGIAKMCDALFIAQHENKDFIIAVEIKTKDKKKYKDQLRNGCRFCQWLMQLLQDHHHYSSKTIQYLGLLVWHPNPSQPSKTKTTAKDEIKKSTASKIDPMRNIYECRDLKNISLHDIIKQEARS